MGKFKLAKGKRKQPPRSGAIPCLILLVGAITLFTLLLWAVLRGAKTT